MLDVTLTLVDYLVKLLEKREGRMDEFFNTYVQPAYEIAQTIYSDYLKILQTLLDMLDREVEQEEIIKFLKNERTRNLPLRKKIAGEIKVRFERLPGSAAAGEDAPPFGSFQDKYDVYFENVKLNRFEKGILGLLMGGLDQFNSLYSETPYYRGHHTLLDILDYFREERYQDEKNIQAAIMRRYADGYYRDKDIRRSLPNYLEQQKVYRKTIISFQLEALQSAWQDVVTGYAEYKLQAVPTPRKIIARSKESRK